MITDEELAAMIVAKKVESPIYFEGERDQPLSETKIALIEKSRKIQLPKAYLKHLATEGAGDFGFGWVYSLDPESGWSLWKESEFLPGMESQLIPFSDNGCGDYYCFPVTNRVCEDRVVWADHEQSYKVIGSDYTDFREFIVKNCLTSA